MKFICLTAQYKKMWHIKQVDKETTTEPQMIAMLRFEVSAPQQSSDKGLLCKISTLLSFRRRDLTLIDLFNTPYFFVFHYPADTASVS